MDVRQFEMHPILYKGRWQSSLKEQIRDLPNFEQVEREVQRHIKKLEF